MMLNGPLNLSNTFLQSGTDNGKRSGDKDVFSSQLPLEIIKKIGLYLLYSDITKWASSYGNSAASKIEFNNLSKLATISKAFRSISREIFFGYARSIGWRSFPNELPSLIPSQAEEYVRDFMKKMLFDSPKEDSYAPAEESEQNQLWIGGQQTNRFQLACFYILNGIACLEKTNSDVELSSRLLEENSFKTKSNSTQKVMDTCLRLAVMCLNLSAVQLFLKWGANPNIEFTQSLDMSLLSFAIAQGDEEVAQALVKGNAVIQPLDLEWARQRGFKSLDSWKVEEKKVSANKKQIDNYSLLEKEALGKKLHSFIDGNDCTEVFDSIAFGADPNHRILDETPLHQCIHKMVQIASSNHTSKSELIDKQIHIFNNLLMFGANLNETNGQGLTPLALARKFLKDGAVELTHIPPHQTQSSEEKASARRILLATSIAVAGLVCLVAVTLLGVLLLSPASPIVLALIPITLLSGLAIPFAISYFSAREDEKLNVKKRMANERIDFEIKDINDFCNILKSNWSRLL